MEINNEREAFAHFLENNLPKGEAWKALSLKERNKICVARRDHDGKRVDKKGNRVALGMERVKDILEQYAPDRYEIDIRFVCRVK